mmetsp:Transcript_11454/g.24994  ORF Transcript_11454/g.24994 Transcript_11454/m.24994 type:complete len:87 (-) Transcript_11454:94-354(-)
MGPPSPRSVDTPHTHPTPAHLHTCTPPPTHTSPHTPNTHPHTSTHTPLPPHTPPHLHTLHSSQLIALGRATLHIPRPDGNVPTSLI